MTREEYYAGIEAYKNKLEHRAMDANAEDTAGKALENWKNQYLNQAINLRAKQYLASKSGRTDDASTYEKQLQILLDKMTNLKGVALSAKQALLQTIDQTATNKANVQFAKHSDEPEDGVLEHGGEWKNHKYIRIENGRYIYEDDLVRNRRKKAAEDAHKNASSYLDKAGKHLDNTEAWEDEARWQKTHGTKAGVEDAKKVASESEKKFYDNLNKASKFFDERDRLNAINKQPVIRDDDLKDEERRRNESAAKAQKEGEAMQAWKDAQAKEKQIKEAAKKGEGESYEKAKAEGEAQQKWKEQQAAKKAEAATAKSPRERIKSGEATADDIRKEIKNKSDEVKDQVYEEAKKYGKDAVVEATELEPDTGAPQRFVIKANNKTVYDTGNFLLEYDEWNYTRAKHSLNLTKEEYYAGIEEYKRKKA